MDFDISDILKKWEFQPGPVMVRRFKGTDGEEKLQLRVDLGLLQMNATGRPDGRKPGGYESLFEEFQANLYRHLAENGGSDEKFKLSAEDCSNLQLEAIQYHHRCICLLQLEDFAGVIRDAERNLALMDFAAKHAESEESAWSLRQFQPQLTMILTRALGSQALQTKDYSEAVREIEEGLAQIRAFYKQNAREDELPDSPEVQALESWLEEVEAKRPLSQRERLERALEKAVEAENYEEAAQVRDAIRNLKSSRSAP